MAKAKRTAKRLKVYGAAIGFFDVVVAAANQGEALSAWGVRQNLFAERAAHLVEDEAAVGAAQAQPGQVLRRPIGSHKPFVREPEGVPDLTASNRPDKPKVKKTKAKDGAGLKAAQTALEALDVDWKTEEAGFTEERAALDERASEARAVYLGRRKTAKDAVAAARKPLGRSGD